MWTVFRDTYAGEDYRFPDSFQGRLAIEAPWILAEDILKDRMAHPGSGRGKGAASSYPGMGS